MTPKIAVLVPCYNEELTIGQVVADFRSALPSAEIYVYDNNSKDRTIEEATRASAIVRKEARQGKGHVVRRMFSDIEADIYIMVDGDATYEAAAAPRLVQELMSGPYDMVSGARVANSKLSYRPGHAFGNILLTNLVRYIFGTATTDMLSGYKVFSKRYVKSFAASSSGFEIETELIIHALELRMPVSEVATVYGERPDGSESKLRTFRDGFRILTLISTLVKEERPLQFFSIAALLLAVFGVVLGIPIVVEFAQTGLVPRLPTAVLVTGLMISSLLSLSCGIILDSITRGRREMKRLHYLAFPEMFQPRQTLPSLVRAKA